MPSHKNTKLWEWQQECLKGDGECFKCKGKVGLTVDHVVPQSFLEQIGLHEEVYEYQSNFQILCRFCNQAKGNRFELMTNPKTMPLLKEFIARLEERLRENNS